MKKKKLDIFPYLLLIPSLVLLLGITLYPFLNSLYNSFFDYSFVRPDVNFVGIQNYIDILEEGKFMQGLGFTIVWTVGNLILMFLFGFLTSILMGQNFFGKSMIKATMLIPWILPQVVTGYIFNLMLAQNIGIVNRLLFLMGLAPADFSWFANGTTAAAAVIIANTWRGFPFIALMLYSKMQSIPASHLEAAALDGANAFQKFRYITMPYIKPVVTTCALLVFLWSFNAFDIIKVMTNGGPMEQTVTLPLMLQREAFRYMEIGRACAMAVLMFAILLGILGIVLICRWLLKKAVMIWTQRN